MLTGETSVLFVVVVVVIFIFSFLSPADIAYAFGYARTVSFRATPAPPLEPPSVRSFIVRTNIVPAPMCDGFPKCYLRALYTLRGGRSVGRSALDGGEFLSPAGRLRPKTETEGPSRRSVECGGDRVCARNVPHAAIRRIVCTVYSVIH